jgi:hypothetical protein
MLWLAKNILFRALKKLESFIKVVRYNLEKMKFYPRISGELTGFQ